MKNIRLPRKVKKLFKKKFLSKWEDFLKEREAYKKREEHLDTIFTRNYKNAWKTFHKMMKHNK